MSGQLPTPSQTSWLAYDVVVGQLEAEHTVLGGYSAQARAPLQKPLRSQLAGRSVAHSSPGSVLFGTGSQKPRRPVCAQLSQVPPQRALQHTPSLQKPSAHSASPAAPALHGWPGDFLHTPPVAHW